MIIPDLSDRIRHRKGGKDSVDDLVKLARCIYREKLLPNNDQDMKRTELEATFGRYLDHSVGTCLTHLRDIDIIQRHRNGPDTLVIHERRDEIVNGEDLEVLVTEELERVVDDMQADDPVEDESGAPAVADGVGEDSDTGTNKRVIRDVLAEEFSVNPDEVENHLRNGNVLERRTRLDTAVDAIEADPAVSKGDYNKIVFISNPYRYELTEQAMSLINA